MEGLPGLQGDYVAALIAHILVGQFLLFCAPLRLQNKGTVEGSGVEGLDIGDKEGRRVTSL